MAMYNYTPDANYYGANESEEERRRRLQQEQQPGAIAPIAPIEALGAEPDPIKQTITYDPVTGEQRMKIEGSVQDLSPDNAMTPTVTMPGSVSPEQMAQQQQMAQAPAAAPQPEPQRELPPGVQMVNGKLQLAPTTPVEPMTQAQAEMPAREPQMAMPQMPQPGPGVQVAGPAQMPPAQQPAAAAQPASADPLDMFSAASGNTASLLQIYNDQNQSPELRRLAGREASRMLESETRRAEAEKEVQGMDQNQLAKLLQSKSEEGSWGKRVLFGLLNMQGAMATEDAKLGIGAKWSSTQLDDGSRVLVKLRADGLPMEGYNATTGTKLDARTLASASTGAGKLNIVGGTYVNDKTGEVGRVVTDEKTGRSYVQTDTGRKSMTGFRPQASAGTLADMNTRQVQELNNQLAYAGPNASAAAREKVIAENEARFGPLPDEYKARVRGVAPQPAIAQTQPAAAQTQPAAAPSGVTQPVSPAAAPTAASSGARAGAATVAPVVSGGGARAGVADTPAGREAAAALNKSAVEADIQRRKELAVAEQKPAAVARGTDAATTVKNQAFADRTYAIMQPINEAILKSTGSTIGAGVDTVAAALGKSTEGSKAIARLNVLSYNILANIPRFEGPQSDIDVQMYKQAAGDFNNRKLPVEDRLAALDALRTILQRYDTAGRNDWSFGGTNTPAAGGNIRIIRREKVQ